MSRTVRTSGEGDNDNAGNSTTSSGMTTRSQHPKPMTVSMVTNWATSLPCRLRHPQFFLVPSE